MVAETEILFAVATKPQKPGGYTHFSVEFKT